MFCKNARAMLAMESSPPSQSKAAAAPVKPRQTKPEVPVPVLLTPLVQQQQPWTIHKVNDESISGSKYDCVAASTATAAPFGGATSLQMLERHILALQQQEQVNRLYVERAMAMSMQPDQHQQDQCLVQMRQLMEVGKRQQRARGPKNKRASAA
jgi:hypothetical protein